MYRPIHLPPSAPDLIPPINPHSWGFSIGGLVRHPLSFSYADLRALPPTTLPLRMAFAAEHRLQTAEWRGVPLRLLLDEIEPRPQAAYARVIAADGHITGLALAQLATALIALEVNGQVLAHSDGFPARLIVPGLYDYKQPRWLQRVELTDRPVSGAWENRGWPLDGEARITSMFRAPQAIYPLGGPVELEGTASVGLRRIARVEVSIDGAAWTPIPFKSPVPHNVATFRLVWQPHAPGDYAVRVRATDDAGQTQPEQAADLPPHNTHAVSAIIVRVR